MKSSLDFFCGFDKLCVSSSEHTYMVAQKTVTQVNVRPEFCDLLPEKGPCHGRWRRQFYNITSKSCQGKYELSMSSIQSERHTNNASSKGIMPLSSYQLLFPALLPKGLHKYKDTGRFHQHWLISTPNIIFYRLII